MEQEQNWYPAMACPYPALAVRPIKPTGEFAERSILSHRFLDGLTQASQLEKQILGSGLNNGNVRFQMTQLVSSALNRETWQVSIRSLDSTS